MRNLVAKRNHNRAATHLDRSKEPQLTVDEGLLDYYAENAQNVAEKVYDSSSVTVFLDGKDAPRFMKDSDVVIKCPGPSEEDKEKRVLRVELMFTPRTNSAFSEFLDELSNR